MKTFFSLTLISLFLLYSCSKSSDVIPDPADNITIDTSNNNSNNNNNNNNNAPDSIDILTSIGGTSGATNGVAKLLYDPFKKRYSGWYWTGLYIDTTSLFYDNSGKVSYLVKKQQGLNPVPGMLYAQVTVLRYNLDTLKKCIFKKSELVSASTSIFNTDVSDVNTIYQYDSIAYYPNGQVSNVFQKWPAGEIANQRKFFYGANDSLVEKIEYYDDDMTGTGADRIIRFAGYDGHPNPLYKYLKLSGLYVLNPIFFQLPYDALSFPELHYTAMSPQNCTLLTGWSPDPSFPVVYIYNSDSLPVRCTMSQVGVPDKFVTFEYTRYRNW